MLASALCAGRAACGRVAPLAHADERSLPHRARAAAGRRPPRTTAPPSRSCSRAASRRRSSLTLLPERGAESASAADRRRQASGDWTLRYVEADERVQRVDGRPNWSYAPTSSRTCNEVPMPAAGRHASARRLAARAGCRRRPQARTAPFQRERQLVLFVAGDLRVSGLQPACELSDQMMRTGRSADRSHRRRRREAPASAGASSPSRSINMRRRSIAVRHRPPEPARSITRGRRRPHRILNGSRMADTSKSRFPTSAVTTTSR